MTKASELDNSTMTNLKEIKVHILYDSKVVIIIMTISMLRKIRQKPNNNNFTIETV